MYPYLEFFSNGFESILYIFLDILATGKTFVAIFFSPEFQLLAEKELLHNILFKSGACHLQLRNLIILMRFSFDPKFLSFPEFV